MKRRRVTEVDGEPIVLDTIRIYFAAWYGFSDDGGEFDPPSSDRRPSRAWCEAVYLEFREYFVDRFETTGSFLAAWPVAMFEPSARLRLRAERAVARDREHLRVADPRQRLDVNRKVKR